jgi:isocitrate/isopropylmalate dehydrogenase
LLGLRKGLGLFAHLRPVKPPTALYEASPLKRELIERTDLTVFRELTGGRIEGRTVGGVLGGNTGVNGVVPWLWDGFGGPPSRSNPDRQSVGSV